MWAGGDNWPCTRQLEENDDQLTSTSYLWGISLLFSLSHGLRMARLVSYGFFSECDTLTIGVTAIFFPSSSFSIFSLSLSVSF